jgi:hypothetical protein
VASPPKISRRGFLLLGTAAATVAGVQAYRYLQDPTSPNPTGQELWASEFGAVGDGVLDDGPALRRALSAARATGAGTTLRLGPGRYRVGGEPGAVYALPVSGATGLSVVGDQATVVVSDPALGCLSFSDCDGCQVEGVTIDYDPPPFTQTVVTALDPLSRTFDVQVEPGYPLLNAPFFPFAAPENPHPGTFGAVFDPATRLLKAGLVDFVAVTAAEQLGSGSFRLHTLDDLPLGVAAGDVFVYLARQFGDAVSCYRSPSTSLKNVHVRAANGVAFALVQSDAAQITACSVAVEPSSGRLVSSNADGVHAQGCRVGPTVEDCEFAAMMDDGLNVYALPLEIVTLESDLEIVVAGSGSVRTGDRLEFSDPASGRITGVRRVAGVTPSGANLILRLAAPLPGLSSSPQDGVADVAFNLSASGEGYLIRGNRYERHRGHAMCLHTGRGSVEDNSISQTSREGIVVSNDPDWPEGPNTRNLSISGNTLASTGGDAAIDVEGRKLGYQIADSATQRNIRIDHNMVSDWRGSAIAVGAAHDVKLFDNVLVVDADAEPFAAERGVLLDRVHDVEIDGLVVRTDAPDALTAAVVIGPTVAAGNRGVRIRDVRVSSDLEVVEDLRADAQVTAEPAASAVRRSRAASAIELGSRVGPPR